MAKNRSNRSNEYERRLRIFRERTGRKRISRAEKEALRLFPPRQVANPVPDSLLQKRLQRWEEIGGMVIPETINLLRFATVGSVLNATGGEFLEVDEEVEDDFQPIHYDDLPNEIKKWSHKSGSYLYKIGAWDSRIQLNYIINTPNAYGANSAFDHDHLDFLTIVFRQYYPQYRVEMAPGQVIKIYHRRGELF